MRPEIPMRDCQGRVVEAIHLSNNPLRADDEPAQMVITFQDGTFTCVGFDQDIDRMLGMTLRPLAFGDQALVKTGIMTQHEIDKMRHKSIHDAQLAKEKAAEAADLAQLETLVRKYGPQALSLLQGNTNLSLQGAQHG